jgi:hypothetical protein
MFSHVQGGAERQNLISLLLEGINRSSHESRKSSRGDWAKPMGDETSVLHGFSLKREKYGLPQDMNKLYGIVQQEGCQRNDCVVLPYLMPIFPGKYLP